MRKPAAAAIAVALALTATSSAATAPAQAAYAQTCYAYQGGGQIGDLIPNTYTELGAPGRFARLTNLTVHNGQIRGLNYRSITQTRAPVAHGAFKPNRIESCKAAGDHAILFTTRDLAEWRVEKIRLAR